MAQARLALQKLRLITCRYQILWASIFNHPLTIFYDPFESHKDNFKLWFYMSCHYGPISSLHTMQLAVT